MLNIVPCDVSHLDLYHVAATGVESYDAVPDV